jgi:hypothetical protein
MIRASFKFGDLDENYDGSLFDANEQVYSYTTLKELQSVNISLEITTLSTAVKSAPVVSQSSSEVTSQTATTSLGGLVFVNTYDSSVSQ